MISALSWGRKGCKPPPPKLQKAAIGSERDSGEHSPHSPCAQLYWVWDTRRVTSPQPLCPEPQMRKSALVQSAPVCCLQALCALITPAQVANGFLLSLLMSQRRMEQVGSLAAWPFRPLCTKEKKLWELQQHNKNDGCFPKNTTLGSSHGKQQAVGSASTSCSLVCHPALRCLQYQHAVFGAGFCLDQSWTLQS